MRQAELLEGPFEDRERAFFLGGFEGLTGDQVAGVVVREGEWITASAITEMELALEVRTPQRIVRVDAMKRCPLGLVTAALSPFDQAVTTKDGMDGAVDGWGDKRILLD